jgi:hypothetical protein
MDAIIKLRPSELKPDFLDAIQKMFAGQSVEIQIHVRDLSSVLVQESQEEYRKRITTAIDNSEKDENMIHFTGKEFEELMNK